MASVAENVRRRLRERDLVPVPAEVKKKVEASERTIRGHEVRWQEALSFYSNDQYVFVSAVDNSLDRLETREGGSKPRHRMRLTRNRMTPAVVSEASLLASRVPVYEVTAIQERDPGKVNAARFSEMALLSEHEKLQLDQVTIDCLIYAILTGAGFSWPYWDSEHGEWLGEVEGDDLYTGEIKVWRLHQGEVLWQPGVAFRDSSWWCVRKAQPLDHVKNRKGYIGPPDLKGDARSGMWERPGSDQGDLVFVYNYLERPSSQEPKGRWLTYAGGHQVREKRDYPDEDGKPVIHELPWYPRPHAHRHLGAGELLVDVQRTWNRTINQIVAWKNLVLVPQMKAPVGSIVQDPTDESGVVIEYRPVAGKEPEWREVPEIPASLFRMLDLCIEDFDNILGMRDIPAQVESGQGIERVNERDQTARGIIVKNLARWYASQGYHLLELIRRNYNEPRMLEVQGRMGVELIPDFVGHKLCKPGSVRVAPASIEPRTKAAMEARILGYAERGWIEPHQAMAAINGGNAAELIDHFELDVARQHREIRALMEVGGWQPDAHFLRAFEIAQLSGHDPADGIPEHLNDMVPGLPMAEDYDNHQIHIDVLSQWMKTREFEQQAELVKQAARNHRAQHMRLADELELKHVLRQQRKAEALGMANAGRDQGIGQLPSPPGDGPAADPTPLPAGH